ncbi:hypothetical protein AURDEDRAFT_125498 [Auricularia subglabra TFB-10046 SS5]|nr:hypothetical protein AURDEDRAFT_125498 [Auricularia subglabra TFB-10046 SS5]
MTSARASRTPAAPSPPIDEKLASLSLGTETADDILALLSERDRPRLCPLRQPYDPELHDPIEGLDTSSVVRAALHLLNDDFIAVHESCHVGLLRNKDSTCRLVFAIVHRREKLYLEAEEMWKTLEHPLLETLYGTQGGPLKFQRAVEGADGKRTGEAKRAPLEELQFEEMKAVAQWAIEHTAKEKKAATSV